MDTLYVINGQTVYSFCFSTRCKTTRTTSLGVNNADVNARSTQSIGNNNRSTFTILFPTSQKTVSINGVLYRRIVFLNKLTCPP